MRNTIMIICLIAIQNGKSQIRSSNKEVKKDTIEYFNIDKYKDWEIDEDNISSVDDRFFKKGNERVRIIFDESTIQLEQTNIRNPYGNTKVYNLKTKTLQSILHEFYTINIGLYTMYNDIGILIKEINNDKPYKFSLKEVIAKVKKEYGVDLEDLKQGAVLERFISIRLNKKPLYTAYLRINEDPDIIDYIIIDGTTGETLYKTVMLLSNEHELPPYYRYIESLKKAEEENNAYYKSYKGKE